MNVSCKHSNCNKATFIRYWRGETDELMRLCCSQSD